MTKKKSTKRALISSLLILAMCFTMLAGTTFAWFTDEVSTASSKIVSGKLDIALYLADAQGAYNEITANSDPIFGKTDSLVAQNDPTDTLWEPGKTQIAFLQVKNLGNLWAKYRIVVDVTDGGLIGSLEYAVLDGVKAEDLALTQLDWAAVKAAAQVGDLAAGRTIAANSGSLAPKGNPTNAQIDDEDYFALAIHMKEEAGNIYQTKDVTIDIAVLATQDDVEEDAFDNTYDSNAELPAQKIVASATDFTAALGNNEIDTVTLSEDIAVSGPQTVSGQTIDGGGNTITVSNTGSDCGLNAQSGTIENVTVEGSGRGIGTGSSGTYGMDGDLTMNNVKVDGPTYGINVGKGNGNNINVTNSTIYGWNSISGAEATFTNCTFGKATQGSGANYAVWAIYNTITFNDCTFKDGYQFFGRAASTGVITLNNCTHDGTPVTAANFASLFDAVHDSDFDYLMNQMEIYVDGVRVNP